MSRNSVKGAFSRRNRRRALRLRKSVPRPLEWLQRLYNCDAVNDSGSNNKNNNINNNNILWYSHPNSDRQTYLYYTYLTGGKPVRFSAYPHSHVGAPTTTTMHLRQSVRVFIHIHRYICVFALQHVGSYSSRWMRMLGVLGA